MGENQGQVYFAIAGYCTCSSLMLIANKVSSIETRELGTKALVAVCVCFQVSVYLLPAPAFVLMAQVVCSAGAVWVAGQAGVITVDRLVPWKMRAFVPVAFAFLAVIFANIKTLQYSNVETFIVFRASTPLIVSLCDYLFLNRELPSTQSWLALIGVLCCAITYVLTDEEKELKGYIWVSNPTDAPRQSTPSDLESVPS